MSMMRSVPTVLATILVMAPVVVSAQVAQDDLRNAIQASVLSDPRAQTIPPEQLKELVDALAVQAQEQNMTASDILWRPQQTGLVEEVSVKPVEVGCAQGWQGYLCQFNKAFGFVGGNYEVPLFLLVVSGLLIAVVWELIVHHRKKLAKQAATQAPPWENMPK